MIFESSPSIFWANHLQSIGRRSVNSDWGHHLVPLLIREKRVLETIGKGVKPPCFCLLGCFWVRRLLMSISTHVPHCGAYCKFRLPNFAWWLVRDRRHRALSPAKSKSSQVVLWSCTTGRQYHQNWTRATCAGLHDPALNPIIHKSCFTCCERPARRLKKGMFIIRALRASELHTHTIRQYKDTNIRARTRARVHTHIHTPNITQHTDHTTHTYTHTRMTYSF